MKTLKQIIMIVSPATDSALGRQYTTGEGVGATWRNHPPVTVRSSVVYRV